MFVLKFIIFLVILVAVLFNGLLLASNQNLSGGEKAIGIALYVILLIVVGNFVASYVTYSHTKDKIGQPGDPGIEGQKGDKGKKAMCKPNCGRKICYVDVKTHAENVLNNEIQKIRGTVQIGYNFITDSVNSKSKISKLIREKLQSKYEPTDIPRDDFGAFSQDYITITKSGESIKVRIAGSKSLGDKLYKEFLSSNKDTTFLDLDINGEILSPNLIIEDIRALKACLTEDDDEKDTKADPNNPDNTMIIEVCGAETTSASVTTTSISGTVEEEELKKFMSGLDRRQKIRNDYFVKKINKICNSNEYIEALERKHRNKINEIQLIEYIKDMLEEMVIYLIQFRVRKTEGFSEGEESKVLYAGLNFLLTKTASENYFQLYKQRNDKGDIIQIKSPILELKKYDIYRWGEKYINAPLIIEKCNADFKLPNGKAQELNLTSTNNYVQVYNSKVKEDLYYEGYTNSCKTYCPFNQMGTDGTNPYNKEMCIYYNINNRGHRNLKGDHISWVKKQYMKPPPLGLYHPKKMGGILDREKNPTEAYFQDDNGVVYYPVGSVWTARTDGTRENRNDFSPVSNNKSSGHTGVGPEKETILLSGNLMPPADYNKIWNSKEGCTDCQVGQSVTIWEAVAPKGYVAMGNIVSEHPTKDLLFDNPPIYCVPDSCVIKIPIGPKIWDSERLIIKDLGPNTFTSADRFILKLNCYLKESADRTKSSITTLHSNFIASEITRLNNLEKDTEVRYCKINKSKLISDLRALANKPYIKNWNPSNRSQNYGFVNTINDEALDIEERYAERYVKMKDMLMKDIRKLNDNITPDVTASAPVYIFSAGASGAFEESLNMPGMKIDNDAGHNLFLACTDLKKVPKFAYKLNRSCLYPKKIKPIKLNSVPGVLNFNQSDRISSGKSAEQYFTYPKDLVIESVSSDYSPTQEPKRYYLSFSNKPVDIENNKLPLYFIRAPNIKTKDFSLCKVVTPRGEVVEDVINTSNNRSMFILENESGPVLNFNNNVMNMKIRLRNVGYETGTAQYFEQFFNENGKNIEKMTPDTYFKFILKRV